MPSATSQAAAKTRKSTSRMSLARRDDLNYPILGRLVEVADERIVVAFDVDGSRKRQAAQTTVAVSPTDVGRDVVLVFVERDARRPIILGMTQPPACVTTVRAELDDDKLVLTAAREIVLKCGEASIILTRAGKVLIRGSYVVTHAAGVNRIKGGSVQIN